MAERIIVIGIPDTERVDQKKEIKRARRVSNHISETGGENIKIGSNPGLVEGQRSVRILNYGEGSEPYSEDFTLKEDAS